MTRRNLIQLGQAGMTLVELMVSMVISMVLLAGVYLVFVGSNTSSRENEEFARLQESARFAMEIIGRDVRMAGYSGCSSQSGSIVNTLNGTSFLYNFNVGVEGFDYVGPGTAATAFNPNLDASIPVTDLVAGNDVLTVRRPALGDPILLEADMANSSTALDVQDSAAPGVMAVGDIMLISDCDASAVFQVTSYTASSGAVGHTGGAGPGNSTSDLGKTFLAGTELTNMTTTTYLIRNNSVGVPSLYSIDAGGTNELVQGVVRMSVRYGLDTNSDRQVDSYVAASGAAANWGQVVAVRVGLLMQGNTDLKTPLDAPAYDLDGDGNPDASQPAAERRMRRVFKSTFTLRNRVS